MPNHVHLIAVPESEDGLRRAIGEAHRRYTRQINFREKWKGHLWQGRYLLDENYLLAATRYIELNPVKAGLVKSHEKYLWSSAKANMTRTDDDLVTVKPLSNIVKDWRKFLSSGATEEEAAVLRRYEQVGRPLGSTGFINRLENKVSRVLTPRKGGRPKKV